MTLIIFINTIMMASVLAIDAFVASFAYGSNRTKVPFLSRIIIVLIIVFMLALALIAGSMLTGLISEWIATLISFSVLFMLGVFRLSFSIEEMFREENKNQAPKTQPYTSTIKPVEAVSLAIALALDDFAFGIGAGFVDINIIAIIIASLILNFLAIMLGIYIGKRLVSKLDLNLTWLGGVLLIILAFTKLII